MAVLPIPFAENRRAGEFSTRDRHFVREVRHTDVTDEIARFMDVSRLSFIPK